MVFLLDILYALVDPWVKVGGEAEEVCERASETHSKSLPDIPSAIMGLVIITALIALSIYTVIAIPYSEGMRLGAAAKTSDREPEKMPGLSWVNFFPKRALASNHNRGTQTRAAKVGQPLSGGLRAVEMSRSLSDYPYDAFPSEINLFPEAKFKENRPYFSVFLVDA